MTTRPTIAIIGAGFSGSLLALHLLSRGADCPRILLIERASDFGRGLAYATGNPAHLLNVRAGNMSAFPDQPEHFLAWLRQQGDAVPGAAGAGPASFVARQTYGHYLQKLISDAAKQSRSAGRLILVPDTAVALRQEGGRMVVRLDVGREYKLDAAVLAIGNFPPQPPLLFDGAFFRSSRFHPDPWAPSVARDIGVRDSVLVVGTGLTMVDTVLSLRARGHQGQIVALSRRGLLPRRHTDAVPHVVPPPPDMPTSLSRALAHVRRLVRQEQAAGRAWQPVIDSLRPRTVAYWQALPLGEKKRFLRHLRPWWDVHRHRLAPAVATQLTALQATGALIVTAGRLQSIEEVPDALQGRVRVTYRPRNEDGDITFPVDQVINCSGPACDILRVTDPLVRDLLAQGTIRPDPLHLGLDVDAEARVLDVGGRPVPGLYAIGPVTRGTFWEMTAVPDIRMQAATLAQHIGAYVDRHAKVAVEA
ncbi:FAD/NAD(P)-binding protein [Nitrospirillum sp. BR 11163]|uniref:FAD/NAD(P)-binding protein n=1 Tax=Nitrospirillum sp. BR 11163 TaxID=3104323 RepID=UPI002AFF2EA2|nr:FAD/NAD(P)-binding protein [Nitrospirillum sp. BR 11163]MEA1672382.1 FAD-dependent oxidoreductase [Nitrospirillum sp. BR 11163]